MLPAILHRYRRHRDSGCSNALGKRGGHLRCCIFILIGDFINEAPLECLLCREPRAILHERKQLVLCLLATACIHSGYAAVDGILVVLKLLKILDVSFELVGVHVVPLGYEVRALVYEEESRGINGDALCPH